MKKLILIVVLIGLGMLVHQQRLIQKAIGHYLSPTDQLTKADVIVVVSGSGDRVKHGIDLFNQGYAPKLLFSGAAKEGPTSNAKAMQIEATTAGIPKEAILLEENSTNTLENATFSKEIILEQGFKKVIIVSSPYHQKRVYDSFKEALKGHQLILLNSPSSYSHWSASHWWDSEEEKRIAYSELLKLIWFKLGFENKVTLSSFDSKI